MAKIAGLQSAIDFTKFVISLDCALIAFLTGASIVQRIVNAWEAALGVAAFLCLVVSLLTGVLVYMRGATMLSEGTYSLTDDHLRWNGVANVVAFGCGAILIGMLAIPILWAGTPKPAPLAVAVHVVCDKK